MITNRVLEYFRFWRCAVSPLWSDRIPIRQELFSVERLEQHAESLAVAQPVTLKPLNVLPLQRRLDDNAAVLLAAYRASAKELESGKSVVPAAEWLLDNYHLVEEQIREIRDDLPPGYYRQLPKLAEGPFAGYPRVLGLAWAFVAHTDSHFDLDTLRRFITAYQSVQPLTIGELWAVAITLRIVLIENLRRLADQITHQHSARSDADAFAGRLAVPGCARSALDADIASRDPGPLPSSFAAQLAKRLRDLDPQKNPALGWLEERLGRQKLSIDSVVQRVHQQQGASNVTVRNIITSMRFISDIDWAELFESVSLVDERLRDSSHFADMDFTTRNLYRAAIEQLARHSPVSELEVADHAIAAANQFTANQFSANQFSANQSTDNHFTGCKQTDSERLGDPGYHLIAEGRPALESTIGFKAPARLRISRFNVRLGIGGYVGVILLVTALLVTLALWAISTSGLATGWLLLLVVAGFFPATDVATALVNRAITWSFGAITLPGLALKNGVPTSMRTLVAVPTLLTSETDVLEQIEQLEVHHLAGGSGDLCFALLLDGLDADEVLVDGDAPLLAMAVVAVNQLNERHGPAPCGNRFFILHRRRVFNASECKWMGWERKRGKLHELNRLLRGATDTTFTPIAGYAPVIPIDVRYVITLDADTRLPRDAAIQLIGKMAHPLNRPVFCGVERRIVSGYAILQPRVTPSLPVGCERSIFQRVFSGPGGIDPYAAAVSDVYQDLFGEGSYTGKGIYDVDAFEAALSGRIPENTLLSHDLFEGVFARAGLASDIEVVEEFPSRYDVAAKRQHRWTRGDWQLLPWMLRKTRPGRRKADKNVPAVGCGKILDNLRRSLLAPLTFLSIGLCWCLPPAVAIYALLLIMATLAIPAFLPIFFGLLSPRSSIRLNSYLRTLMADVRLACLQVFLLLAFLPDQAWRMVDAIVRTLVRLLATRRHMLEWTTSAQVSSGAQLNLDGFYKQMALSTATGLLMATGALLFAPWNWPLILPIALLWLAAPALALWVSQSPTVAQRLMVHENDARELRLIARRTWRFFETFVTPADSMLPPDNFQETPKPVIAHRTSPTNIGLYLLSTVVARDFGWAGTTETIERLEATLDAMQKLARFKGHFFNWYGTEDLAPLLPAYVSSVDSGNLAGHLLVVANACEVWLDKLLIEDTRAGMTDNFQLAQLAMDALPASNSERRRQLAALLKEIESKLKGVKAIEPLKRLTDKAATLAGELVAAEDDNSLPDLVFWLEALRKVVAEHGRDRLLIADEPHSIKARLTVLADRTRAMAMGMDFEFLMDRDRHLLSIGYSLADNSLDSSCYDLLASEARLASLFAIAKGDATTRHWFRLGRTATPLGNGSALISWSGSMFEYLMPSLVMRAPVGSLLEQTNKLVVARQQAYGQTLGIPWGVSESAYNARDLEFTYQYSNFGVPGLGLKRGLSDNLVIAPYATGLAAMVNPKAAQQNFKHLTDMGALGSYGFYEALDFTRSRLPDDEDVAIVRNYMAHHQGMTIVSIANTLSDGQMRSLFHREPMIQACELLLQERMPRNVAISHPRAEEVKASIDGTNNEAPTVRSIVTTGNAELGGAPITHLLSNGRYVVMLTAAGAGYSRWRDIAITRWQEDSTRDNWGSFLFLRDVQSGDLWSAGTQTIGIEPSHREVVFAEDYATFTRRDGWLTTTQDILVSGEDASEVRRVSLANNGRKPREIELTSYTEVVLALPATDNAHPAFSRMFVVTSFLPEFGALVATRRLRSHNEEQVWAAHFVVVEGEQTSELEYETDRARFIGRGNTVTTASALVDKQPLSNTVGTVLDPIFSLRQRVVIPPGKSVRVAFWTVVASSQAALLDLIDKHNDTSAFDRAKTLAWTQAQVQLRHLDVDSSEAADFQRLATPVLYADPRFRVHSDAIIRGAGTQSGLWPQSISGDLPIVLLRIDDIEDMAQVRQLLRAHEYWRMKRLAVDLVIVNERASSYIQDLQIDIETAVRSSRSKPRLGEELTQGSVHTLRADLMSAEIRALLQSAARVVLLARRGNIAAQLSRLPPFSLLPSPARQVLIPRKPSAPLTELEVSTELAFFNGLGGFDKDGREYVTVLKAGQTTPAPWINVIANAGFGFNVSAEGSGYIWADSSRENQLTSWSNDAVTDPSGEVIYVRDEDSGEVWSATAQPIRDNGMYVARHGFGYSRFEHQANGIALDLLQYVPLEDPIKISRLTLRNLSGVRRKLSVTAYTEWVLGTSRSGSAPFIITDTDANTGALLARNPWSIPFGDRIAFADLNGQQSTWTTDRLEFLGKHGSVAAPAALAGTASLSGSTGAGLDPCAALQCVVDLGVGESIEIVSFVGECRSVAAVKELVERYRKINLDTVFKEVTDHWQEKLSAVQVTTPDHAMNTLLNGWLLYQTIACRVQARSAFYQASGAYGFRDQLQDGMALTFTWPEETRKHLLRAAGRQFVQGDVQHWWLPYSGQGVRTHISDDRVWLAFATATYIAALGDTAILDESVPFLDGPAVPVGEHDAFFQPMQADESASLFEHCARALDQCLTLIGEHGLPLMGTGDWNDGMNHVAENGKGESVWLGWLLLRTLTMFVPLAKARTNDTRAQKCVKNWSAHITTLSEAMERETWDGEWYRRATFDDGTWLGSKNSEACQIDSIAQSWAVLSGAANVELAAQAMESLSQHLIRHDEKLALLFTPPFDNSLSHDPGYIQGYPPGLRENGGQYSHAAMWAILAFAKLGEGDKAFDLFSLLNPINHARTAEDVARYKVEPYVVAADVYSVAPHVGRGGWTWYTGAAGWMYQAGVEGILGIRREGNYLVIDPCIPAAWPSFSATVKTAATHYEIQVKSITQRNRGVSKALLDDVSLECVEGRVRVPLDGGKHVLLVTI